MATYNLKRFINNPNNRAIIYQLITLFGFFLCGYYLIDNLLFNIEQRGISTGFSFLTANSGFEILYTLIDYDSNSSFFKVFLVGIYNTILVSILGIICATIIGLFIGIGRLSNNWLIAKLCAAYIEIFRNIPILLQIIFWYKVVLSLLPSPRQSISIFDVGFLNLRGLYLPKPIFESASIFILIAFIVAILIVIFMVRWSIKRHHESGEVFPIYYASIGVIIGLPLLVYLLLPHAITFDMPQLKGFNFKGGISLIPEFLALLFALSIYTATYIAEAIRSGIEAVSRGQKEAAFALGLKNHIVLRKVVLPQALRVAIPPIINQYLNLTKNSSLATAIGYPELVTVFAGTALNQVGQAVEIILMTMAVYLTLSITISFVLNWYNKKMAIKER